MNALDTGLLLGGAGEHRNELSAKKPSSLARPSTGLCLWDLKRASAEQCRKL